MVLPIEERAKFFVFVIESPSAADLYNRRSEGELIRRAVELNRIPCQVRTAISLQILEACLVVGLSEAMRAFPGYIPLLHISAHGDEDGIQLSDGHIINWNALQSLLRPINQALNGTLIVCMSSCSGYMGVRMAMCELEGPLPYYALIGCGGAPTWSDTAVAFATLYHQLHIGEHIDTAVQAMRVASGNSQFWIQHAETSRRGYIEHLTRNTEVETVQTNLEKLEEVALNADQEEVKIVKTTNAVKAFVS
ncbi:hypothetical protein [Polaromonas sp. YR568]|uniref:hypothetical protein n=1 Tax=Polaromonas sp. YR568 TaxID=1855301 RepID=UPI00398C22A5